MQCHLFQNIFKSWPVLSLINSWHDSGGVSVGKSSLLCCHISGDCCASDLKPNIRNNCSRKKDKARHIVCLDCFNFKSIEVPPLTDVRRKVKKLQLKTIAQEFSFFFFFLLLLLEAMRESLCLLLRTGRWIRYWRLINSGILSLQIRPEVPIFYFLLVETKPGNAHSSAQTYVFICVYDRRDRGSRAGCWAPRKLVPHCSFSADQHSHTAALTRVKAACGQGADAGSSDGDTHPARWWPVLRIWSPWLHGSGMKNFCCRTWVPAAFRHTVSELG